MAALCLGLMILSNRKMWLVSKGFSRLKKKKILIKIFTLVKVKFRLWFGEVKPCAILSAMQRGTAQALKQGCPGSNLPSAGCSGSCL